MAITVKLKCSECSTVREVYLQPEGEQKELACPACQRRNNNLTAEEYKEIETVQKKQFLFCIVALVLFAVAAVCLGLWVGDAAGWASKDGQAEANAGFFFGAIICAIASMVLGILGSLKRFVVEF